MALSNVMKEIEEEGILDPDLLAGLSSPRFQDSNTQSSPQIHAVSILLLVTESF
jgi:hypothetical protein